ncbi:MAG: HAD-IIB family hydrolase [Magnetovibrio sp.]|nr:HAD-IIB family hydrolase [Magnetovibrio sp.]
MAALVPLSEFPDAARLAVHTVLCDIDDTLTTQGRLTADAYAAMERLRAAGKRVVPVTGRPAGWCDLIARQWPVDGVVGENGAFYFRYDDAARRMLRGYHDDAGTRAANRARLDRLGAEILAQVPGAAVSADQAFRVADLAIDYREDVAPLDDAQVRRILGLMTDAGLTAKVSSIHVNGWIGEYDKLSMTRRFLAEAFGVDLGAEREGAVFVGDSPNDQPAFAFFPHSVGVANIRRFAAELSDPPAYVTGAEGGAGFAEVADLLLAD